jgi:thiol-disulfide isomerase/thioredoxin
MNRRRWLAWGGGAVALSAGAAGALWYARSVDDAAAQKMWGLRFERPEGGELAFASLRGRPLLLNFWATWCPPCVTEMPLLDRFHRDTAARGWQVVGLAVDGPSPVREFLARRPVGFPIGLAGLDGVELARSLGNISGSLPFSLAFDAAGRVRERKLGMLREPDLQKWLDSAG